MGKAVDVELKMLADYQLWVLCMRLMLASMAPEIARKIAIKMEFVLSN